MNKKIKYLLILFISVCTLNPRVVKGDDIDFYWEQRIRFNQKLGFSTSSNGYKHGSLVKRYRNGDIDGAPDKGLTYCADMKKDYTSYDDNGYVIDKRYETAKCYYQLKSKSTGNWYKVKDKNGKATGDCSQIIGYIIKYGTAKGGGSEFKGYGYTQAAIWVFLRKFSTIDSWKETNAKVNDYPNYDIINIYNNDDNKTIKTILQKAFTEYHKQPKKKNNVITNPAQETDKLFKITGDSNLYFSHTDGTCGNSGIAYKTKQLTLENPSSTDSIKVTIEPQTENSRIIVYENDGTTKVCSSTKRCIINMPGNSKYKFIVKSTSNKNYKFGNIKLAFSASKTSSETDTTDIYDSVKYKRVKGSKYQGLIIGTKETVKVEELNKDIQEIEKTFPQQYVKIEKLINNNPVKETNGECASPTNDNYISKLKDSTCKVIRWTPPGKETQNSVRIYLTENVIFNYGSLIPSSYKGEENQNLTVFSGGAFKLNTNDTLGPISSYNVGISWVFAETKNGKPYYYNSIDPANNDAIEDGIVDIINQKLESEISNKLNNLKLKIDTFDSNYLAEDGKGKTINNYKISILKDSTTIKYNNGTTTEVKFTKVSNNPIKYETTILAEKIQVKKYKIKKHEQNGIMNGIIEYIAHSNYASAVNKRSYFVPMHFPDGDFKFNIDTTNLSLLNEIELNYTGICSIKVENRFKQEHLRYRSINLEKPFPKATQTSNIPLNWRDWYADTTNKERITNTLEQAPIYTITLTREKIKEIEEINKDSAYTSWKNMNENGSSSIIGIDLFEDFATTDSYCKLGEFNTSCDKY